MIGGMTCRIFRIGQAAPNVTVSDVALWWDHIVSLDLPARYGVKTQAPEWLLA
jgi:hypothetical protein